MPDITSYHITTDKPMVDTSCEEQIDYVCVKTDEIGLCGTGRRLVWDREY